ncbi:NmrA family NAD(P)-binding protein [Methylobacterium oryzisoli]|uniref:NmrA family NAD(P)-binding protein n=1 Tax=Methylobacterium oryzisoli TaxID=3385502 RepID=UPI0038914798
MTAKPRLLVLGATGKVGGAVVRTLAARGDVAVVAGLRGPGGAEALAGLAIEIRRLNLDEAESLEPALAGIDCALLLTGYSVDMLRQSKRFLDAARAMGVRHIVHVGASGAATNEVAHWGWHQLVEAYAEARGFAWTHLRPESFMQNLTSFGWLNGGALAHPIGSARWSWVDCEDVAAVAAAALAEPDRYAGQVYRLGTEAADMAEVTAVLRRELGHPIRLVDVTPEAFHAAAIRGGGDPAYLDCILHQFRLNRAGAIPGSDQTFDTVEHVLGRPGIGWAEHVRRNAAALGPRAASPTSGDNR